MTSKNESHHIPGGGNVLYMDGHVEYVKWGTWPYTDEAAALFNEMDRLDEVTRGE